MFDSFLEVIRSLSDRSGDCAYLGCGDCCCDYHRSTGLQGTSDQQEDRSSPGAYSDALREEDRKEEGIMYYRVFFETIQ